MTVTAQCADNANTTNTTSLQVTCNQNGNWSGEIPICFCNEGYQEVTIRGGHLCQSECIPLKVMDLRNDFRYSYLFIFCITVSSDKSVPSDSDQNNICNGCEVITPSVSSVSSDKPATSALDQGEHAKIFVLVVGS